MAHYSLFCGDKFAVSVYYKTEIIGVLSKEETEGIRKAAAEILDRQVYSPDLWLGYGYLEIKLNPNQTQDVRTHESIIRE